MDGWTDSLTEGRKDRTVKRRRELIGREGKRERRIMKANEGIVMGRKSRKEI